MRFLRGVWVTKSIDTRPGEGRALLLRSVFEISPLPAVAAAVSVATEEETRIDYDQIVIGFRSVADGVFILCADPEEPSHTDAWAVIDFDAPTAAPVVHERIVHVLRGG